MPSGPVLRHDHRLRCRRRARAAGIRRGDAHRVRPGTDRAAQPARGHTVAVEDINSGLQGIVFNAMRGSTPAAFAKAPGKGRWGGGADPRREGTAKGTK